MTEALIQMNVSRKALLAGIFAICFGAADAQELRFKTEVGGDWQWPDVASLETSLGFPTMQTARASLRAMADGDAFGLQWELHGTLVTRSGDAASLRNMLSGMGASPPPATLFDFNGQRFSGDTETSWSLDRANVTWTSDTFVLRVGRQAITWGNGLVFSPSDVVAPFSPNSPDRSYKTGTDMIYAQYLLESGADIQAVYIPRPLTAGGAVSDDASTYALRGYANAGNFDLTVTLARDRGEWVVGLGGSGSVGEGALKADVVVWDPTGGTIDPSWVINYSNFASLGDLGFSYFVENYRNGFGVAADTAVSDLPSTLASRMSTGQVFFAGRSFWAGGLQAFVTPDLMISPTVIMNSDDQSALLSLSANYTLGDNTDISLNYSKPFGANGTEFGGRETTSGGGIYVGPPESVSVKISQFF